MIKKRGLVDIESVRDNLYHNAKTGDFAYVGSVTDAYKIYFSPSEINSLLARTTINKTAQYLKQIDNAFNKDELDTALNYALTNNQMMRISGKLMLTPLSWRIDPNHILRNYRESLERLCNAEINANVREINLCTKEVEKYTSILKNTGTEGDEIFKKVRESVINKIMKQNI